MINILYVEWLFMTLSMGYLFFTAVFSERRLTRLKGNDSPLCRGPSPLYAGECLPSTQVTVSPLCRGESPPEIPKQ